MDFGTNLNHLRTERGINQKDLALELQVSVGTISNYEKNIHFPNPDALCKIACYFNVSTDYLLGRTQCQSSIRDLEQPFGETYTLNKIMRLLPHLSMEYLQSLLQYLTVLKA